MVEAEKLVVREGVLLVKFVLSLFLSFARAYLTLTKTSWSFPSPDQILQTPQLIRDPD